MFEGLIPSNKEKPSNTEILGMLLSNDNVNLHTDMNMRRIRTLCQIKWFRLSMDLADNRTPLEKFDEIMEYYKELLISNKRIREDKIIDGLKHIEEQEQEGLTNFIDQLKK